MRKKKLDIIVANKIGKNKKTFGEQKTSVFILTPDGKKISLKDVSKEKVSGILLDKIENLWYKRYPQKN